MKRMMEPMQFVNGWRFLQIGVFIHLWIIGDASISTFILLLLLLVITSLRWRFRLPTWTVFLDVIICLLYVPYTDISYYGLAIPIFELAFRGKWPISLMIFVSLFFHTPPSFLLWYYVQAFFFGVYSSVMIKNQHMYKLEADEQRKARYELERVRMDWLSAVQSASHQAELMERYRISRQLHDHLGHDLTGASLALQAYEYIQEPEEAKKLFQEVKHRIERSTTRLRETVHNVTPTAVIGVERLEHIVRNFGQMDIAFDKMGDMLQVPAYILELLEACLKEALTNVARHSDATKVEVEVQVTESIVRLWIRDNGTVQKSSQTGSGLRSIQLRARSLGGSLSISRDHGFLLVCVMPLHKGGSDHEAIHSR